MIPNLSIAPPDMPEDKLAVGSVKRTTPVRRLPANWHDCNGQQMAIGEYPELYVAIGYSHTTESQKEEGHFRLPEVPGYGIKVRP